MQMIMCFHIKVLSWITLIQQQQPDAVRVEARLLEARRLLRLLRLLLLRLLLFLRRCRGRRRCFQSMLQLQLQQLQQL
eukprot:COSAG06_NODE_48379_length_332_cov_1.098712_1_plen_78_part_00